MISKMGAIESKMGRKFEQKSKMGKKKLIKAYSGQWTRIATAPNFAVSSFFLQYHSQYLCSAISPLWCSAISVQVFNHTSIQNSAGFAACTWYSCVNYCFEYCTYVYGRCWVCRLYMVHILQLLVWFCCIICLLYYLLDDFQCLSECLVCLCSNHS